VVPPTAVAFGELAGTWQVFELPFKQVLPLSPDPFSTVMPAAPALARIESILCTSATVV